MALPTKAVNQGQAPIFVDNRGSLTAFETAYEVPFDIKRVFVVHDVNGERGGHAHLKTNQVLFPVGGTLSVRTFDGNKWMDFRLVKPSDFLFIPPMVYLKLQKFSKGASCVVLADSFYDKSQTLGTLEEFKSALRNC